MTEQHKEIKLERRRGFPFCIVFSYLPDETLVLKGDSLSIDEYTKNMPTHHAWRIVYTTRRQITDVRLLGQNTYSFGRKNYLSLVKAARRNPTGARFYSGRNSYVLYETTPEGRNIIRRYRQLPKRHLTELATYDARIASEQDMENWISQAVKWQPPPFSRVFEKSNYLTKNSGPVPEIKKEEKKKVSIDTSAYPKSLDYDFFLES